MTGTPLNPEEPLELDTTVQPASVLPVVVVAARKYAVAVKRHENVVLTCPNIRCARQQFAATFDEVQRLIPCPTCQTDTEIPPAMRGMP